MRHGPIVRCSCGAVYSVDEWRALPRAGIVDVERDHPAGEGQEPLAPVELRTCRACGSTMSTTVPYDRGTPYPPPSPAGALVVEDDGEVARAMARVLKAIGFTATVSRSGADALARVQRGERFELVVSDVRMPGLDGPGFHEAARALWPQIDAVIVYVTGARLVDLAALKVPCFRKPVEADFYAHVRAVLEAHRRS